MVLDTKDTGRIAKLMGEEGSFMQMEMCTRVIGRMTKHMVKEYIPMLMVQNTKVTGMKISSMDRVLKDGQMELNMKASIYKAKSTERVNSLGLMVVLSQESFMIITFRVMEYMNGLMEEYLQVIGKTTKWKVMVLLLGQMAENM